MNQVQDIRSEIKDVPIRHMDFKVEPSQLKKYCYGNNRMMSAVMYAFLGTIPFGERMVINSVREWRDEISDPVLKAKVTGLIGQEAIHSKVHEDFNDAFDQIGIPMKEIENLGERFIDKFIMRFLSKRARLAACAGFEHFTSSIAEIALAHPENLVDLIDEPLKEMLTWHLMEELEHKSVAFDVYQDVCGKYSTRLLSGIFNYMWVTAMLTMATRKVLKTPDFQKSQSNKDSEYLSRQQMRPPGLAKPLLNYFKPSFHPDQSQSDDLLHAWRDKLFGNQGEFQQFLTKVVVPK